MVFKDLILKIISVFKHCHQALGLPMVANSDYRILVCFAYVQRNQVLYFTLAEVWVGNLAH